MTKYRFRAKNNKGHMVSGTIEAGDEKQAVLILRERGLVVVKVSEVTRNFAADIYARFFQKVGISDVATFTRQLSTMVTAGLQLTDALSLLREQSKPAMTDVISGVQASIQGGSTLADALAKHPKVFSRVYISLVKSGEAAGVLDEILARLSDNLEKQREFNARVKGAMIYPAIVMIGMGLVAVVMMVFVVPKLTSIYSEFNVKLPAPTKFLMSVSRGMATYWWLLLVILAGGVYGMRVFALTKSGRRTIDTFKLKIPIVGNLSKQIVMTEFARTMSLMISAGISIIDALNVVAEATGNVLYEESLKNAAKQIEKGFSLALTLAADPIYPPIVPQMISVGEETGKVDEVLGKLAKYFESESDQMVKGLTAAIEPIIMVVLGLGVGFLVVAIIMPIYSLTSAF